MDVPLLSEPTAGKESRGQLQTAFNARNADASQVFRMVRIFATGQALAGSPEPQVVPSPEEADMARLMKSLCMASLEIDAQSVSRA
jgi:hypothetical protein